MSRHEMDPYTRYQFARRMAQMESRRRLTIGVVFGICAAAAVIAFIFENFTR